MHVRLPAPTALLLALSALAGCSGGGGAVGSASISCATGDARAMCLTNCNLGCTATGCQRTDIAQNENIVLQFSKDVDPASVSASTVRFRTATGEQPVGELFVNGNQIEFVPTLRISGGQSFFGFTPGETYTMTLPGGPGATSIRSTSGEPLSKSITCTLVSNRGIIDLNGVAPRATLLAPTAAQLTAAPRDGAIVLEFNEIVDPTPFLGGIATSPVVFTVRRTRAAAGGGRECDSGSQPVPLVGTQRLDSTRSRSVLTFQPASVLPGNICVEINVTSGVVDLSGRPAQPQTFQFLTEQVPLSDVVFTEGFDTASGLDAEASAATWGGGVAVFHRIGGDAIHGSFDVSLGQSLGVVNGKRTFVINTDNTIVPAERTRTGSPIAVTDGRFFFDTMVVPSDVRLRFTGTHPPVFTVAGRFDIQGEIDVAGQSIATLPTTSGNAPGQPGAAGGIFGGAGGQGGDKCLGTGPNPAYNGRDGQAVRVPGGHAYESQRIGTPGRGSTAFPATGLNSSLIFATGTVVYTPSAAAGGSGGGYFTAGEAGRVVSNNHPDPVNLVPPRLDAMGPSAPGGAAYQVLPIPAAYALKDWEHFLVGGAGGGGGGSHACLTIGLARAWAPGCGGGGGGGAVALRAGTSLRVGPVGAVVASGGSAASTSGVTTTAVPAPGGGGSGGSVVLQSGLLTDLSGVVDVRGGNGGIWNRFANGSPNQVPFSAQVEIRGGNGAPGFVRCEVPQLPTNPLTLLPNALPAAQADNVAALRDADPLVSCRSNFYSTGLLFGPEFVRYEIHATVDGVPMVFSDDPAVSTMPAQVGAPIRALFQAANLDLATNTPTQVRPWRNSVRTTANQTGIASDGLNGFRFMLIQDRAIAQTVVVDRVVILYRV